MHRFQFVSTHFLVLAAWAVAVCAGFGWLAAYAFTPGATGRPASAWPQGTGLAPAPNRFALVVGLHPECPCSRATVRQLGVLLGRAGAMLEVTVVFADEVPGHPAEQSDLYAAVRALPAVRIQCDRDGTLARRFDFQTSGETRLYRPDGTLAFAGGITVARGHEGDSPGTDVILAALRTGAPGADAVRLAVFGCAL